MNGEWSQHEKAEYKKIRVHNLGLGLAYIRAGLPSKEPGARAAYLIKELELTDGEQSFLMAETQSNKPKALRNLEKRAIDDFF